MVYVRETSRDVNFEVGDCAVMGDIGGGTTDAVPYRLAKTRLVELAPSTGITFGSTNLDQGFKTELMKDIERDFRPGFDLLYCLWLPITLSRPSYHSYYPVLSP